MKTGTVEAYINYWPLAEASNARHTKEYGLMELVCTKECGLMELVYILKYGLMELVYTN
jgi:hypothetical protein